jgi:hypothetical protein
MPCQLVIHVVLFEGELLREVDVVAQFMTRIIEPNHVDDQDSWHYKNYNSGEFKVLTGFEPKLNLGVVERSTYLAFELVIGV